MTQLKNIDLNLLVLFQTLMEERHVSRAARKLGLSQSAFSHALRRLRTALQDPLFVRIPTGMIPTQRAEQIYPALHSALQNLQAAISDEEAFDPKTCASLIRISIDDYLAQVIGVSIARGLLGAAPHLKIEFAALTEQMPLEAFRKGQIQFAVRVSGTEAPGIYRRKLLTEKFVCLMDKKVARAIKNLTLKRFVEHRHLLVSPYGGFSGVVDEALQKMGLKRDVQVVTAHFSMAPWLLLGTERILTLPESIANSYASYLPVQIFSPPIDIETFSVDLLWWERDHHDALSRWARETIMKSLSS